MNILRQLWQDAQSVLRDMSVTQRVAVTFLILTVAVWLTFAAWMGASPAETGKRPLPMQVEPADANDILTQLKSRGVGSADYDLESRRIIINVDEEKQAIIALAEEGLLRDSHEFGFIAMLDRWSFSDPTKKSDEAMRLARANEVGRLVENIEPVKEARVIYSDDARNSLFGVSHRKTASVSVKTTVGKILTEETANTIISLVAAAKAGLDPRDVVVTDQKGNKFHASSSNGLSAMARQKWDYEYAEDEKMRRKVEALIREFVPNIHYGGDVLAFPKHDINFDYIEELKKEVLPGEVANTSSRKTTQTSSELPNEEPGVNPNVRRVANMGSNPVLYTRESRFDEKVAERTMQNSIRETATKFAPSLRSLTISAIVKLPYRLKMDENNQPVQAVNEHGQLLIDPETRLPMHERESVPYLNDAAIEQLKRQIAMAAGIDPAEIPEKIEISQVAWTPPVISPPGGEAFVALALRLLSQNMTAIVTFIFFAFAVFIVYRYATRPIPTEIEEPMEEETLSLAMTHEEDDEENSDEEWDKLRAKVTAAVQEDPKRAANLLKRWMRKE
jgi:Flagellar biosynthesis/type III secretory pathway lipoprotein